MDGKIIRWKVDERFYKEGVKLSLANPLINLSITKHDDPKLDMR